MTLKIKGLGPSLGPGGVPDPVLEIRDDSTGRLMALDNDGGGNKESEVILLFQPGKTYALEEGNCGNSGSGRIEVYDMTNPGNPVMVGSAETMTGNDTDGDALPDEWEKTGMSVVPVGSTDVCYPGNVRVDAHGDHPERKFIDLHSMGAKVNVRDIFVHADWMLGLAPTADAMQKVVEAFANEPYGPINLHIDLGPTSPMDDLGTPWGSLSEAHDVPFLRRTLTFKGDLSDFEPSSWGEVDAFKDSLSHDGHERGFNKSKRSKVFHYVLFANALGCENSRVIGASRGIPGNDFAIGLGSSARRPYHGAPLPFAFIEMAQSSNFMHELGHNLGLKHGGFEHRPHKPNYISVMNYLFNFIGVINKDGRTRSFDYSQERLPPINEFSLNEFTGIREITGEHRTLWFNGPAPVPTPFCPPSPAPIADPPAAPYKMLLPWPEVDWNMNRMADPDRGPRDVDGSGLYDTALEGFDDWKVLMFSGDGSVGVPKVQSPSKETSLGSSNAEATNATGRNRRSTRYCQRCQ